MALPDSADRARAIIEAMDSIEADYENLRGVLPKGEYQELDNQVLGQLLRTLNPEELKTVKGDVFGRIYEYFLTQFADQKAHDGGEFFTPISLVSLIAHVLDPVTAPCWTRPVVPAACSCRARASSRSTASSPTEKLTFRGLEKNATTIRLAKMNLAVHGLEGDIQKAITYYEDPHELVGKADYVMANPPFNVDEIDADKVKSDPRLPFGLPGVNKKGKVSNGNYIWISYFYSYLNDKGRAGFVMSSQASSAGGGEAKVRQKLVETGDVDVMIAIRSNFFYTRTVPCELWFLNRNKPKAHKDKVLMIDARNVYRKVTRKIYDFSPEQQQNLLAIVWLYRGQTERYLQLVSILGISLRGQACFEVEDDAGQTVQPLPDFDRGAERIAQDAGTVPERDSRRTARRAEVLEELEKEAALVRTGHRAVPQDLRAAGRQTMGRPRRIPTPHGSNSPGAFEPMAEASRDLIKQTDLIYKLATRLIELRNECDAKKRCLGDRDITRARKAADEAAGWPSSNSSRCATSGNRPIGSPNVSRRPSYAMWKGWSSWWTSKRSKPTTGASHLAAMSASLQRKLTKISTSRKRCARSMWSWKI